MHRHLDPFFDELAAWRRDVHAQVGRYLQSVVAHTADESDLAALAALRERLADDDWLLVVVADDVRRSDALMARLLPGGPRAGAGADPVSQRRSGDDDRDDDDADSPSRARRIDVVDLAAGAAPEAGVTTSAGRPADALVVVAGVDCPVARTELLACARRHAFDPAAVLLVIADDTDPAVDGDDVAQRSGAGADARAHAVDVPRVAIDGNDAPEPPPSPEALARAHGSRLGLPPRNVFVVAPATPASPLAQALGVGLAARRRRSLVDAVVVTIGAVREGVATQLGRRIQQQSASLFELRGLHGRTAGDLRRLEERVGSESGDIARCGERLAALRSVQARLLDELLQPLSADALRDEFGAMRSAIGSRSFVIAGGPPFDALVGRLRAAIAVAGSRADELRQLLQTSLARINAEFGTTLAVPPPPALTSYDRQVGQIGRRYRPSFGYSQAWRLLIPSFDERLNRVLALRLRAVLDGAVGELQRWSHGAAAQAEAQFRDRQRACQKSQDALSRLRAVATRLDGRIAEVQLADDALFRQRLALHAMADDVLATATRAPGPSSAVVGRVDGFGGDIVPEADVDEPAGAGSRRDAA